MYVWLWRTLPGGLPGKLALSTLLAAGVVLLLFTVVFPAVEPLLPFGDVTLDDPADAPVPAATPTP